VVISEQSNMTGGGGAEVAPGVIAPPGALRLQFARSGGPGGQNVNKLNTKAELWVKVDALIGLRAGALQRLRDAAGRRLTAAGEVHLVSESERGQEGNRAEVFGRLREMIVRAKVEPKTRRKTKPSKAQKAKRLEQKKRRSDIKSMRRSSFND
jgi:ribosome-associated protein